MHRGGSQVSEASKEARAGAGGQCILVGLAHRGVWCDEARGGGGNKAHNSLICTWRNEACKSSKTLFFSSILAMGMPMEGATTPHRGGGGGEPLEHFVAIVRHQVV